MNPALAAIFFIGSLIFAYAGIALFLLSRRKKFRQLQPPEAQAVLRGPGESQRRQVEKLLEQSMDTILTGACLTVVLALAPLLILQWMPTANLWGLLLSGLALFFAGSIWIVRRVVRLMERRANARLGWLGERMVSEHLQACGSAGFHLVHDVPAEANGHEFNLDHVAIGKNALVVIETKMRSKPADKASHEIEVLFDGERLSWPRFPNDTKSVWQVGAAAKWLRRFVREECGIDVPVKTVIAIPGWKVKEKVLTQPRVVSGKGVAAAVDQSANSAGTPAFSRDQRDQIAQALESRCRDTET